MAQSIYLVGDENNTLRVERDRVRNGHCTLRLTTSEAYPHKGSKFIATVHCDLAGKPWVLTRGDRVQTFKSQKAAICTILDEMHG